MQSPIALSAGTSSSTASALGLQRNPALHGSKQKNSARCAVPPNSKRVRERVRRNSSPISPASAAIRCSPGAERQPHGRGSERALALFSCLEFLTFIFRQEYKPSQRPSPVDK